MTNSLFLIALVNLICYFQIIQNANVYNHGPSLLRNATWMSNLDDGVPIRQLNIIGTRNSIQTSIFSCNNTPSYNYKQYNNISIQLQSGIRALDIRFKHYNNSFMLCFEQCDFGITLDNVLIQVSAFLANYSSQTVLLHLVQETNYTSSGCNRSIEDTFIQYKTNHPGLFWDLTTQNSQLGEVRGMVVLLQQFFSIQNHGLLWVTIVVQPSWRLSTNWDLYTKWLAVKNASFNTNNLFKQSSITYWTGQGGVYPYFVASGKSTTNNTAPRLNTGLTTPGFSSNYPDFPRIACYYGICTIVFEGINILGYNYITSQNYSFIGIIYTDFYGDDLILLSISLNQVKFPPCNITLINKGCTLCSSNGTCIKCNMNMNYKYDANSTQCLAQSGYYLDGSYIPQLCSSILTGCLVCANATTCLECDSLNYYQLDSSLSTCMAASGYYLNNSSIPRPCQITGCQQCQDASTCLVCSTLNNFIPDPWNSSLCSCDYINFFTLSQTNQSCICMAGYYLDQNSSCQSIITCPILGDGCLACAAGICAACDSLKNFTFDQTNSFCVCAYSFYLVNSSCVSCSTIHSACIQCANQNLCLTCMTPYVLINRTCHFIPTCSVGCLTCISATNCTVCDTNNNFIRIGSACDCRIGMFELSGQCFVCSQMSIGCKTCNSSACLSCNQGYGFILNGSSCICNSGYTLNMMQICQKCTLQGCLHCINSTACNFCDPSEFYLNSSNLCDDICGDGKRIYVQCDDGNLLDGDGCSSLCRIQASYTCAGGSRISADVCSYSGPINLKIHKTIKHQKQNKINVRIKFQPLISSILTMNLSSVLNPQFPFYHKQASYDLVTGTIVLEITYNSSLNTFSSKDLQITFDPPTNQSQYYFMTSSVFFLPEVTSNNLALKYYDQDVYQALEYAKILTYITVGLYLTAFIICFIFVSKLIAVQLILIPQVTFSGLIMIEKMESLLQPLRYLFITNGHIPLNNNYINLPPRISNLFFGAEFINNFNILIILILLPLLIGLSLYYLGKTKQNQNLKKRGIKTLKQIFFSSLLVFQFQYTIAFLIDIMYGRSGIGIFFGLVLILCLIGYLVFFNKKPFLFGQYKSFFGKSLVSTNFYIFVVLFRFLLSLDLVLLSHSNACGFMAAGFSVVYLIILLTFQPYLKNRRPIFNISIIGIILIIESIYKINFYDQNVTFASYLPFLIISLLIISLIVNIICMVTKFKEDVQQQNNGQCLSQTSDLNNTKKIFPQNKLLSSIRQNKTSQRMQHSQILMSQNNILDEKNSSGKGNIFQISQNQQLFGNFSTIQTKKSFSNMKRQYIQQSMRIIQQKQLHGFQLGKQIILPPQIKRKQTVLKTQQFQQFQKFDTIYFEELHNGQLQKTKQKILKQDNGVEISNDLEQKQKDILQVQIIQPKIQQKTKKPEKKSKKRVSKVEQNLKIISLDGQL